MDAVVELLIGRIAETVEEKEKLILGIKDQVEDLLNELRLLGACLAEAARNKSCNDNAMLRDVVEKFQRVVNDAEDAIDKYVVERRKQIAGGGIPERWSEKVAYYAKVNEAAKEMESIKKKAQRIRVDDAHRLPLIRHDSHPQPVLIQAPMVEEDDVVGFDDEDETIIKDRCIRGSNDTNFVSIVGRAGSGKTTFTKMIFKDPEVHYKFFPCLWIDVSGSMNRRQIFMNIISHFTMKIDVYKNMSEEQLVEIIREFLKEEKYFIVMDDVWSRRGWDYLKIAFPNNQKGSTVLLTTRLAEVGRYADSYGNPHYLKPLHYDASWELLQKKAFGKETCPAHLKSTAVRIASQCQGLPLAIEVIAGVLYKNSTAAMWRSVAEDPVWKSNGYNELVKYSYKYLPDQAKKCFLYLAAFPAGHEISAWKLIRLWIAEGFIPSSPNMESIAETYLEDIVNRNLLMVLKRRADGKIKTCSLRDIMHEFCKIEAGKNNFCNGIDGDRIKPNDGYRRLCLHSSPNAFIVSEDKPSGEYIRSFLTSAKFEIPKQHLATIPKSYPLLRVLDSESLKFQILPKELYQLYHLRYLAISTDNNLIPKLFSDLWNLQTLVFNTSQCTVDVKAEIWNMTKLRHILANASLQLPPPSESCKENSSCPELQTLSTISPKSCTQEIFEKTLNLLKLGVRGNVAELLESKEGICLFENIRKLHNLEKLKLMHEAVNDQASTLLSIPQADKFPGKLRNLTLSKTSFEWKDICVLGSLDWLEVLKLEEFAAKGDTWELNNVVFKSLQFLRIGRTDLAYWTSEMSSFPALKRLQILHCEELKELPLAFKDVKSLKIIELFYNNKQAATSARKIRDQRYKEYHQLVLSIYPLDH